MGRPAKYTSIEEKRKKAVEYGRLYKIRKYNIENDIVEWCSVCNKHLIIDPIRPHLHWKITSGYETIVFD